MAHRHVRVYLLCMGAQQCLVPSVYLYIYRCVLYIDMYILYMQVLNECHAVTEFVSCRLTSILHACTVQFVCTHMDVCITMYIYILYMQVLNECHAVTEFVSCRLQSILHACTVPFVCTHMDVCMYNVHIHSLHAGAQ